MHFGDFYPTESQSSGYTIVQLSQCYKTCRYGYFTPKINLHACWCSYLIPETKSIHEV